MGRQHFAAGSVLHGAVIGGRRCRRRVHPAAVQQPESRLHWLDIEITVRLPSHCGGLTMPARSGIARVPEVLPFNEEIRMSKILRPALLAAALTTSLGVSVAHAAPALTTQKAKNSYLVGMDLASGIPPLVRQELDPAIVADALRTVLAGQKPAMSEAEAKTVREAFMKKLQAKAEAARAAEAQKNEVQGAAFLAKNKARPGVKTLPDGLQYEVIKMGTGPKPTANDTVQINYTGTFINGQKFDASAEHGGPASIPLGNVIPGFREGLTMFPVGSHFKLFIPANLAYGANPQGPMPPNETLIFDVETLKILPPQPAAQAPAGGNK